MIGDASLFARQDGVEASWRVVDQFSPHRRRSMNMNQARGDSESQTLIAPFGGWQCPRNMNKENNLCNWGWLDWDEWGPTWCGS